MSLFISRFVKAWLFIILVMNYTYADDQPNVSAIDSIRFVCPVKEKGLNQIETSLIKAWVDHGIYFHDTAVAVLAGRSVAEVSANTTRLLQNAVEIGNIFGLIYGPTVALELTTLLQQHIAIGSNYLAVLQSGNPVLLQQTFNLWIAQGQNIASFLAVLNPFISLKAVSTMFNEHVTMEALLAVNYFQQNYFVVIQLYDQLRIELAEMGEFFAVAIVKQLAHENSKG